MQWQQNGNELVELNYYRWQHTQFEKLALHVMLTNIDGSCRRLFLYLLPLFFILSSYASFSVQNGCNGIYMSKFSMALYLILNRVFKNVLQFKIKKIDSYQYWRHKATFHVWRSGSLQREFPVSTLMQWDKSILNTLRN